jgi:hypothetical protein
MSPPRPDEPRLAELFAADRSRDAARAPSFERVVARRVAPRAAGTRWVPVAAALAAALIGGIGLRAVLSRPAPAPFAIEVGRLHGPTDFLLDLAGPDLTRAVPRIGVDDWYPLAPPPEGAAGDSAKRRHRL